MSTRNWDYLFKIILIGSQSAGKTALLTRYSDNEFRENYLATIGIDFHITTVCHKGKKIKLNIYDSAGMERFRSLGRVYYRSSNAAIVCYDSSDRQSFDGIYTFMEDLEQNAIKPYITVIAGNKIDLEKVVSTEELKQIASTFNCRYFETSSKDNIGVAELFETLIDDLLIQASQKNNKSHSKENGENKSVKLNLEQESKVVSKESKCCS